MTVALPPSSIPSERSNAEVSSGAGELSDSVSVGEVAISRVRKKKMKVKKMFYLIKSLRFQNPMRCNIRRAAMCSCNRERSWSFLAVIPILILLQLFSFIHPFFLFSYLYHIFSV